MPRRIASTSHTPYINFILIAALIVLFTLRIFLWVLDFQDFSSIMQQNATVKNPTSTQNSAISQLYFDHARFYSLSYLDILEDSQLAPLTKEAQRWIHEHQNPPTSQCKQAKYVQVWWNAGLGSNIATAGTFLGFALEAGYILQWHPQAAKYLMEEGCSRDLPYTGMECLFQPLSTCGPEFMNEKNTLKAARSPSVPSGELPPSDISDFSVFCPNFGQKAPQNQTRPYLPVTCHYPVPSYLTERLTTHMRSRGISVTRGMLNYWFQAQTAAYIARVNKETRATLAELRQATGTVVGHTNSQGRGHAQVALPFPLPPGSFNIHVRHGDKHMEQPLFPFNHYVELAEELVIANPLFHKRVMFLSTEDPAVFAEAASLTRLQKQGTTLLACEPAEWLTQKQQLRLRSLTRAIYTTGSSPDLQWVVTKLNHTRPDSDLSWVRQLELLGKQHVLFWILELFIAMECDAWVASRGSGWDRLIDQLRCVWVDKCNAPFLEVSDVGHY